MVFPFRFVAAASILFVLLFLNSTVFNACGQEVDATAIVDSIALKAGMSDLSSSIMEIKYTYSAKSSEGAVTHGWEWFPKTDDVIFTGKDPLGKKGKVTYSRKALKDTRKEAAVHTIDAWFVNDLYWLLFPYFLKNDPQKRMTRNNSAVMPLSGKWATGITVEYYKPDPRRPGDKFEVYVDSLYQIKEWVVYPYESHRAVAANKWENYRQVGPFMISFSRIAPNGKGIAVKISEVKIGKADE
jgi:hypothetical protein